MTAQEYLDLLIKSCEDGTFPSEDKNGDCAYRGENGKKCAVGLLISDELYDRYKGGLEGLKVGAIAYVVKIPEGLTLNNLREIQRIHDFNTHDLTNMKQRFLDYFSTILNVVPSC